MKDPAAESDQHAAVLRGGECADAEDLLNKLSPLHPYWQPDPAVWIFRGQGRDLPLFPKAYRKEKDQFKEYGITCPPESDGPALGDAHTELHAIFQRALDRAGLAIPVQPPQVRREGATFGWNNELERELYPLMALAQHVGLPTQLLDWSLYSRFAAYFAAASAARAPKDEPLVVWALNSEAVREEIGSADGNSIVLLRVPRASNPNLHAQSGVFTWQRGPNPHLTPLDRHIEQIVTDHPAHIESGPVKMPFMRRLTLPGLCAPRLLRLLSHEGVDGSVVFPGYEGVVKAIRERALWDK